MDGFYFDQLPVGHQQRFHRLVKEHTHAVNAVVTGLSALPGTARPFAATRAMTRFLNHDGVSFTALLEPAQDAVRAAVAGRAADCLLVAHDWAMFSFHTHARKADRYQRSHEHDLGYELGSALVIDAATGQPLGPMELRLRTADGMLSTRVGGSPLPPGHVDELLDVFQTARSWKLGKPLVHVVDREADSVGHYRRWHARGHHFLVRADAGRLVLWRERERNLSAVVGRLAFADVRDARGRPAVVTIQAGTGSLRVAETEVVLHRPARTYTGEKRPDGTKVQVEVPGPPLPLRLVVSRVVAENGAVLAEWCLFTNVARTAAAAARVGQWYAWRWRIESLHKLLKTAGQNAEQWLQASGAAWFRRLCVAVTACLTVWHLQDDDTAEAARLRRLLTRLSGRQMKHGVESTAPALLAGLEKLLALDDLMQTEDLTEVLELARHVLPRLFRSG